MSQINTEVCNTYVMMWLIIYAGVCLKLFTDATSDDIDNIGNTL